MLGSPVKPTTRTITSTTYDQVFFTRSTEGASRVTDVALRYKLGSNVEWNPAAKTRRGRFKAMPTMSVDIVDQISPTLNSTIAVTAMVATYRKSMDAILDTEWKQAITKAFEEGPSRWPPLSPGYARWKGRQKHYTGRWKGDSPFKVYAPSLPIANLILSGHVKNNVYLKARDAVGRSAGVDNPRFSIDPYKQFSSTPYVWIHEFGMWGKPVRDFIRPALREVSLAFAGVALSEVVVVSETLSGAAVTKPRIVHETAIVGEQAVTGVTAAAATGVSPAALTGRRMATVTGHLEEGGFSWGWLGRWFSQPYWWIMPPSKAYLYLGIASDIRSVLLRGIAFERMIIPFGMAWGLGMAGARAGVPLTKKTARRRTRRTMWR